MRLHLVVGKALEIASPALTALGEFLNTSAEAFNTMIDGLKILETESAYSERLNSMVTCNACSGG